MSIPAHINSRSVIQPSGPGVHVGAHSEFNITHLVQRRFSIQSWVHQCYQFGLWMENNPVWSSLCAECHMWFWSCSCYLRTFSSLTKTPLSFVGQWDRTALWTTIQMCRLIWKVIPGANDIRVELIAKNSVNWDIWINITHIRSHWDRKSCIIIRIWIFLPTSATVGHIVLHYPSFECYFGKILCLFNMTKYSIAKG